MDKCLTWLAFFDVEVLGVSAQNKEGHRAQPDVAAKAWQVFYCVDGASCEGMLSLYKFGIVWVIHALAAGNHVNIGMTAVIAKILA